MSVIDNLWPYPCKILKSKELPMPESVVLYSGFSDDFTADLACLKHVEVVDHSNFSLTVKIDDSIPEQGYSLAIRETGMQLKFSTLSKRRNGQESILQILGYANENGQMPAAIIEDAPHYNKRCFMTDLGRSTFNVPMLKLLIKMLRGCKKINLTICRKNHDLILGPTTRSIPSGM